jgi:arylsulfatase
MRALVLLLAFLGVFGGLGAWAEVPKPDILFLMPDQMRGDCLSVVGHPAVRTPHLDELAAQGAVFRRAYSTCPSCIPARYALLTGLFPATTGVVGYAAKPITQPTLPELLARSGYTTILVGRWMHQTPTNEPYGFQAEFRGSTHIDDDEYDKFLKQAAPEAGGIRALVAKHGLTYNGWEAKPWPLAEELHPNVWIVNQARKALQQTQTAKPLFLTTSFYSPHPPLFPPKRYFDACIWRNLPAPAHGDWVDWRALSPKGDEAGHCVLLEGDTLRAAQAGYFGLIEQLDDLVAPLIEEFKERSQRAGRPWVIVLSADHGEMLGDHGYFRKCEPFEGSANIPLLVTGSPELGFKPGLRSMQPVCLEDVMPTLLDLAGVPCPKPMDGVSLVPVLRGSKHVVRDCLLFEHAPAYSKQQAFLALTDGRFKYIWRPQDGTEHLFDLTAVPQEEHDLARVAAQQAVVKQWRERLARQLVNRPEGFSDGTNLITGRPYPPIQEQVKRKPAGSSPAAPK